jgi:hypothetical protein
VSAFSARGGRSSDAAPILVCAIIEERLGQVCPAVAVNIVCKPKPMGGHCISPEGSVTTRLLLRYYAREINNVVLGVN